MDIIDDVVNLGLGALVFTRERAEKVMNDLVRRGKLTRTESKALLEELVRKGRKESRELEGSLAKLIKTAFSRLDIATKSDIRRLEGEIKKMRLRKS